MVSEQEEIQKAAKIFFEIIYDMFLKDLKNRKLNNAKPV
jgi:hypothetical protein